jgi:transposase-like protein
MAKKEKLKTPNWIIEGYESENDYNNAKGIKKKKTGKTFKVRKCPKCKSDEVSVLLGKEEGKGKGEWQCKKCKWEGKDITEEELSEKEFMKYLDEKGEPIN